MSAQELGREGPQVPYEALLTGLRRFIRTEGECYLDDPNVCSIGLGHKVADGRETPELAVQFTVEEKCAEPEALTALGTTPVPESITVAGVRIPTDVLERRSLPAFTGEDDGPPPRGFVRLEDLLLELEVAGLRVGAADVDRRPREGALRR
ncbi:hypothetical protein ACI79C_18405 [Geodermatophilus sp. SYSU D00697]